MKITEILKDAADEGKVEKMVQDYVKKYPDDNKAAINERLRDAAMMNKNFYTLVTDFYLNAWGKMFHFGVRKKGQDLQDALRQHEVYLADKLQIREGEKCLDIGCGVGGPMMNIAKKTKAKITGINNTTYQIKKGREFVEKERLENLCSFIECDWMKIPLGNESFDKAYSIEASCHAADQRPMLFKEINRLLKPRALFGGYEWILTKNFDEKNPLHRKIKNDIEVGNGLSNLNFAEDVACALEISGFRIIEMHDRAEACDEETPWYLPLKGESTSIRMLRMTPMGRFIARNIMRVLEATGVLKKGTLQVSRLLNIAGEALVKGGEEKIFTPMFFFLAEKK